MHNRTLGELDRTDASMTAIVGYAGLLLWLSVAAALWGIRRTRHAAPHTAGHLWTRLSVYALVLAALYPAAALNRVVFVRPGDGALIAFSLVALNALVWSVALCEAVAWFTRYDGAPPHWNVYDLFSRLAVLCVVVIAAAAVSSEAARFVNLLAVAPLAAALVWVATAEAGDGRSVLPPSDGGPVSRPRLVLVALASAGLLAFVLEMLAPSYGNVVGVGVATLFMLAEHALLAVPLLLMATASDTGAAPPHRRVSPPPPPPDPIAPLPPLTLPGAGSLIGAWDENE
jgi:hypothetical protein